GENRRGRTPCRVRARAGTTAKTESVTVNGDGTYTTPTGVLATQVGTYTWSASYSGDGLNNGAIDNGADESVTTVKASPAIATTAIGTASCTDRRAAPAV